MPWSVVLQADPARDLSRHRYQLLLLVTFARASAVKVTEIRLPVPGDSWM
jgi:hypothetical protein